MTVLLKHLQTQIHAQQSQVIFAEPADVGFGCISRRRAFTIFLRRDAGSWVQEPQEVYNRLSAKLKQKQLPLSELLWADQAQIESEVHQLTKAKKSTRTASCLLTSFEQKNKEVYQQVLADKGELPQNVVYVPSQNPKWVFKAARAGRLPCFTATDKMLYVDALNRPITSSEKFSGHGYPAREDLAKALGVPAPCQQCSHCHIYTLVGPMSWCVGVPQETIPSRMCVCVAPRYLTRAFSRDRTLWLATDSILYVLPWFWWQRLHRLSWQTTVSTACQSLSKLEPMYQLLLTAAVCLQAFTCTGPLTK